MTRNNFLLPSLILAVAIVLTGAIATLGFYKTRALTNTISVTGSAERMIVSDTAKWTVQITHATDVSGLQQSNEAMQNDLEAVKVFLDRKNIPSEWVTTQPVSVETMYDYNRGGAPSGYTLRQNVIVEGTDVNLIRSTAEAAGELIAKGAVVSTLSLEYFYSGLQQLKAEILADAMADARMRATQMVESAGGKLGNLRSASMGVLQVTAKNSVDISDYGMYDTSVIEKKVTAVVRSSFGLK